MLPQERFLWQTADPTTGATDTGSVSVANGVMYAGSQFRTDVRAGHENWTDPLELRERGLSNRRAIYRGRHPLLGIWLQKTSHLESGITKVYAFTLAGEKDRAETLR